MRVEYRIEVFCEDKWETLFMVFTSEKSAQVYCDTIIKPIHSKLRTNITWQYATK